ncbi:restriction endonuclease subunit S [Flavobacterium sp. LT1R49]|uniref:restriction endonuclease subunit S n=1 Tax=Flavobacterium arabinosi TaxID=3398737 RepID=UPI003A838BAD
MGEQLPKKWTIVPLEKLGEDKYYAIGDGDHGQIRPSDYRNLGIPYIRVGDLDWGFFKEDKLVYISEEVHNKNLKSELLPGDILIAKTGATIGKCCIVPNHIKKANTTSSVGKVSINKDLTSSKWILYYFLSPDFFKLMWSHSHRTAQPGFNIIDIKNFPVPLPPLLEQNRIVTKLDTLFAQLENIKTSMANIPLLLKNFRQQVLTKAVTGKLTEEWRKGKELEEWRYELAQDCCEKVQSGGTPKGSNFDTSGIPFLKVYNIVNNKIDFEYNPQYVSESMQNSQIKKSITFPSDVVMNIVGPPLNKIAIIPNDYPEWNLNQAITLFRTKEYLLNKFLYYFFCEGSSVNSLINETKGVVGQVNISLSQCRNFSIPVPSPKEQQEIVHRVESLFAKAEVIEQQYKALKTSIDTLPQALLNKAFKGQLAPQLESDGDARDLLEKIQKLKTTTGKVIKNTKLEKLKEFNKKMKNYPQSEGVLVMVAEDK